MHRFRYLIGLATLVAAVVGAIWIVRLLNDLDRRDGMPLTVEFREARGLRAGADVRFRGVTVGSVRSVGISGDGTKAVATLLLDAEGAANASVDSSFWVVTPRFGGLTGGASGLDTLVRDAYVAFQTPAVHGSPLVAGSLLAGRERPPQSEEPEALDDVEHGDLLMSLLVPENHGLRPGSTVVFRGTTTGDVRSIDLAPDGSHVVVQLRIARRYRQTVTDQTQFWVARPYVTGALFSGFTVADINALLSPYVSYYGEPGKGVVVPDGYRAAAQAARPTIEPSAVPSKALAPVRSTPIAPSDSLSLVRITYAAIERDTLSADDPVNHQGSGVLYQDRTGRTLVVTARSLVDGNFTEADAFGTDPDIANEQINVLLANGDVRRCGRIWVDPGGADLAVLLIEDVPPNLSGTPGARFSFDAAAATGATIAVHDAAADGSPAPAIEFAGANDLLGQHLGAALLVGDRVVGVLGSNGLRGTVPTVVGVHKLPVDLRPE